MEFDNTFEVPLAPEQAWRILMDIERIAPCMPGAQLTEKVDDRTYKGRVGVRLGPVALSFAGTARFEEIDNAARVARVRANGTDSKGRGGANSTVTFRVEPSGAGSTVLVHTDLSLSGSVAQYGRGVGMIQEVASQLIRQFATSLRAMIQAEPALVTQAEPALMNQAEPGADPAAECEAPQPAPAAPSPAAPISGFSLMLRVLWASLRRLLGRPPA